MFGLGKGNGKVKATQLEVSIDDMAVIGADLATFAIACIVGGVSGTHAAMTANNILVREVQSYAAWKQSQTIINPKAAEAYLQSIHERLFQEMTQLAAITQAERKKEESNDGTGSGNQGTPNEVISAGDGDSKAGIA